MRGDRTERIIGIAHAFVAGAAVIGAGALVASSFVGERAKPAAAEETRPDGKAELDLNHFPRIDIKKGSDSAELFCLPGFNDFDRIGILHDVINDVNDWEYIENPALCQGVNFTDAQRDAAAPFFDR